MSRNVMVSTVPLPSPNLIVFFLLATVFPGHAQVTFSAPASYTVGTNPGNIVTADFNGDGIPDLAVANKGDSSVGDPGSVSLLLDNGDGTFQPALNSAGGANPQLIFSGDFNGDGKLDLLVLGQSSSAGILPWTVVLGNGDGTFGGPSQVTSTFNVLSVVVGDFNRDKKLDFIFIDGNAQLQEVLGNGDGTFRSVQVVGQEFGLLQAGDFNGDGKLDLAVTVSVPGAQDQVLLGNGDGSFRTPANQSTNANANAIAIDLNHDGRTDLITESVRRGSCALGVIFDYSIQAYVADRNGILQPAQQIASSSFSHCFVTSGGSSISIAGVGDFDGDGNIDVVVFDSKAGLQFFGGKGNGRFLANAAAISGSFVGTPIAMDLNGDKLADPNAGVLSSTTIGVVLNTTQGFSLGVPASIGPVKAGGSVAGTVSVDPQNGSTSPVSLTCSAPQSVGIRCSLSSSTVAPGASSTLTVTTTGNSAGLYSPRDRSHPEWIYALCLPFAVMVFGGHGYRSKQPARSRLTVLLILGLLLGGMVFQSACGGGSSPSPHNAGTPSGTYSITVIGTAGTISRSTTVSLTVQ